MSGRSLVWKGEWLQVSQDPSLPGGQKNGGEGLFISHKQHVHFSDEDEVSENLTSVCVCVCVYLCVSVVVDVAGRDHVTDGICLRCHFLLHQQRQIHNLEKNHREKAVTDLITSYYHRTHKVARDIVTRYLGNSLVSQVRQDLHGDAVWFQF